MKKWLLSLLVLVVYLLHQDCWNWKRMEPLVFGFLPIGLAYHAGYSVLATLLMWVLVRFAWPDELDGREHEDPTASVAPSQHGQGKAPANGPATSATAELAR